MSKYYIRDFKDFIVPAVIVGAMMLVATITLKPEILGAAFPGMEKPAVQAEVGTDSAMTPPLVIGTDTAMWLPRVDTTDELVEEKEGLGSPATNAAGDKRQLVNFILESNRKVFPALAEIIADGIISAGEEYDIPPVYLLALAYVESTFNYHVVSKSNCVGLLQINPAVWVTDESNAHSLKMAGVATTVKSLYDPVTNLRAGAFILSHYWKQGKDKGVGNPLKFALTRYLGGDKNNHYAKFESAVGKFYVYTQQANPDFLVDRGANDDV